MPIDQVHVDNAARARALYLDANEPGPAAARWGGHYDLSRRQVVAAMTASQDLRDVAGALEASGSHTSVFRQLLAPPVSQDQFKLICPSWSKGSENNGRPVEGEVAQEVRAVIESRLDGRLAPWIAAGRAPVPGELDALLSIASTLMAVQKDATARRNGLAFDQEGAVIDLLKTAGWTMLPSKLVDERAQVAPRHFMHKTRFATTTTAAQEVDIACGLAKSNVVAMECKVSNDETNSVKRINDVIKKATAWRDKWGAFVHTAALLQGVIAPKDVQRLTDAGVHVFWSHDLDAFLAWVEARV